MTCTDDDLTPWFPPDVKPVHEGVYQVNDGYVGVEDRSFAYWDGARFKYRTFSSDPAKNEWCLGAIDRAYAKKHDYTAYPSFAYWRGLNKQP